jgi:hypothetical protein
MTDERDDSRLAQQSARAPRGGTRIQDAPERQSRARQDRPATEDRELTDVERLEMFQQAFFNDQLPMLPPIEGYHFCWLTTTNSRDTIPMRLRLGYELIKAEEVRGFEQLAVKEGAYPGCVMVNEMIAAKLPNRLYQMYMTEVHHDEPNREEGKIRAAIEQMSEGAQRKKSKLLVEEAMREQFFEEHAPGPDFVADEFGPPA